MKMKLSSLIAPSFWNTFNSKKPRQIDKGGRGSTKTSKNSLKVNIHCLKEEKCSAIIIREYQNTLRDSVYKEIKRALKRMKLIDREIERLKEELEKVKKEIKDTGIFS